MPMRILSLSTIFCTLLITCDLLAARDITADVRAAGKVSFELIQGTLASGSSIAKAFDGSETSVANFSNKPSFSSPVVFDVVIADDFDFSGAIVSRFALSYGASSTAAPNYLRILGSNDGGTSWTELHDDDWGSYDVYCQKSHCIYWVKASGRGVYRRYRFEVRGNGGGASLSIPEITIYSDKVWYVSPGGNDEVNTGANGWADAITVTNAVAKAASHDVLLLKTGTHLVAEKLMHTKFLAVLGGYVGTEGTSEELSNCNSVLDANYAVSNIFDLDADNIGSRGYGYFHYFGNLDFTHANGTAVVANSNKYWSVAFDDCRFIDNCSTSGGRGFYQKGSYQNTTTIALMHNCEFRGNGLSAGATAGQEGSAIYLNYVRLRAFDCRFIENGLRPGIVSGGNGGNTVNPCISISYGGAKMMNCDFIHNRGMSTKSGRGAVVYLTDGSAGYQFNHCNFVGNETVAASSKTASGIYGGLAINLKSETSPVKINQCTFAYNIADTLSSAAALTVVKGTANVTNCIFAGNIVSAANTTAADIAVKSTGNLTMDNSLVQSAGTVYSADPARLQLGSNIIYGDAKFVTPKETVLGWISTTKSGGTIAMPVSDRCMYYNSEYAADIAAIDVHLLSSAGYRKNGSDEWFTDTESLSPAIDAGDQTSDYSNEPTPNGSRVNLGAYGNTAEASKTPTVKIGFTGAVSVDWEDGYSQPVINVTTGGEPPYSATLTIYCGTGALAQAGTEYQCVQQIRGVQYGQSITQLMQDIFVPGEMLYGKVILESGSDSVTNDFSVAVGGTLPPWFGKTGPANVIHVRPGAKGRGTGESWHDAVTGFYDAFFLLNENKNEIWFAGDVDFTDAIAAPSTISPNVAATIRGGFEGTENSLQERKAGARSTFDGARKYSPLVFNNENPITLDSVTIKRTRGSGLKKTGNGDIIIENCDIVDCGQYEKAIYGYGLSLSGNAQTTKVRLKNCVIAGNGIPHQSLGISDEGFNDSGSGFGSYFNNLNRAVIENCTFITNGIPFTQPQGYNVGWRRMNGSAIYSDSAPLTVIGTKFIANRCHVNNLVDETGSTVVLAGGTGGSVFTNCLWVGNQNVNFSVTEAVNGGGGEVRILGSDKEDKYDFVNCTFAANLNDVTTLSGGVINARVGTVDVKNCIFATNISPGSRTSGASDIASSANSVVNISYSIFESPDCLYCPPDGVMNLGRGIIFGEAKLISSTTPLRFMLQYGQYNAPYFPYESISFFTGFNAHLRGCGYRDEVTGEVTAAYPKHRRSPAVDAGDPAVSYRLEPTIGRYGNGRRVNMGFYGNTPWATLSPKRGFAIRITGPGSAVQNDDPVVISPERPIWNKMLTCDQSDQKYRIFDGTNVVWCWSGEDDTAILSSHRSKFSGGVAECKVIDNGARILTANNSGGCAIVDVATTNAVAYCVVGGWPHSIELIPGDIMVVASTQTQTPSQRGLYFRYYGNGLHKSPNSQPGFHIDMDNPHGAYWCPVRQRLYVSDTQGLHLLKVEFDGTEFKVEVEKTWSIAPLGLTYGHDLIKIPNRNILSMTTHEKVTFFDMDKEEWLEDMFLIVSDVKGFDIAPDGTTYLLTIADKSFNPNWVNDTIYFYTQEDAYQVFYRIIGGKFYKARWYPYDLKEINK